MVEEEDHAKAVKAREQEQRKTQSCFVALPNKELPTNQRLPICPDPAGAMEHFTNASNASQLALPLSSCK